MGTTHARAATPRVEKCRSISQIVLRWYDRNRRLLPWRILDPNMTPDPWAVWVSEVMLQQTPVTRVMPYYRRFIRRFPTPHALATASEDRALAFWSGLGYYSRAKRLRLASIRVSERLRLGLGYPRRAKEWQELPGIGPYSAAAIASIAFGEPVPAIDGNVARVVVRLLDLRLSARAAVRDARIRTFLSRAITPSRPGDFNQAMMELGEVVCLPTSPHCGGCPLSSRCRARRCGRVEERPLPSTRPPARRLRALAFLFEKGGRYLMRRRERGMATLTLPNVLEGLWEVPTVPWNRGESLASVCRRLAGYLRCEVHAGDPFPNAIRHAIEHYRIDVHVRRADLGSTFQAGRSAAWIRPDRTKRIPVTGLTLKILGRVL